MSEKLPNIPTGKKRDKYGMTKRQRLFVETWKANGENGTEAALATGYGNKLPHVAKVRASEILAKPGVKRYLKDWEEEQKERMRDQVQGLVQRLEKMIAVASAEEPVPGTGTDIPPVVRYDPQVLAKSIELLGKYLAMWTDKQVITINDDEVLRTVQVELSKRLDSNQVIEILEAIQSKIEARRV